MPTRPAGSASALEEKLGLARLKSKLFGDELRAVSLGRYVIGRRLGAGGAGLVYAARDPKLDREVAIKLVRDDPGRSHDAADRRRLVREAKALAKVSHPNILPIYDVGVWAPEGGDEGDAPENPFIVMELVQGWTLGEWVAEHRPRWPEVVAMFEACARGLTAAHEAGLVHRDFKPANVLIGADRRPRVSDFGLARRATAGAPELGAPSLHASGPGLAATSLSNLPVGSDAVTAADSVSGTPAYMAPEQLSHGTVDARSDQYALCVALFEALTGKLPFEAKNARALTLRKEEGDVTWPARGPSIPRAVQTIVDRGLSPDPADRFATMAELADALLAVRRRRGRLAALAGVGAIGTFASGWALARDAPSDRTCVDRATVLGEVWSDAIRSRARASFEQTGSRDAPAGWDTIEQAVDAFVDRWSTARDVACTALAEASDDRRPAARRHVTCLDAQLQDVGGLLDVMQDADTRVVERATEIASLLPDPSTCSAPGPNMLLPGLPEDDESLAARRDLATANALRMAGRCGQARDEATAVADRLDPGTHGHFVGRALLLQALSSRCLGETQVALDRFHRAATVLEASADNAESARVLIYLAQMQATGEADLEAANRSLDLARAKMEASDTEQFLEPAYLRVLAVVRFEEGRYAEAAEVSERRLAMEDAERNPSGLERAEILHELAMAYHRLERWDDAARTFEASRAHYAEAVGTDHPVYASPLANLAMVHQRRGEVDRALERLDEAVTLLSKVPGRELMTAEISMMRGYTLLSARRYDEAAKAYQALRPALVRGLGEDHPQVARADTNVAEALTQTGDPEGGLEAATRAVEVFRRVAPEHRDRVWAAISKTDALVALGRVDDARAELEAFAPEPDDPTGLRVAIHRVRGHVEEAAREWAAATGHYGRARDIAEAGHEPDFLLAELEFDLARVTLPTDRNAAITLAQSALGRLPQSALLRPTIESWLDELYH